MRQYPNQADLDRILGAMGGMKTRNDIIGITHLPPLIVDRGLRVLKLTGRAEPVQDRPTRWRRLP